MDMVAIHRADPFGFPRNIEGIARLHLHPESQFKRLDARFELRIVTAGAAMFGVQFAEQAELPALDLRGRVRAPDVLDELLHLAILRINERPLKRPRQKSRLPVLGILHRHSARAHGHKARQILVLRPEPVERPCPETRARLHAVAAVHQHQRRLMIRHLRIHRADHRDVIRMGRSLRKKLADLETTAAIFFKTKRRGKGRAGLPLSAEILARKRLARILCEQRLRVKCIQVGGSAVQEEVHNPLHFRREMRHPRRQR